MINFPLAPGSLLGLFLLSVSCSERRPSTNSADLDAPASPLSEIAIAYRDECQSGQWTRQSGLEFIQTAPPAEAAFAIGLEPDQNFAQTVLPGVMLRWAWDDPEAALNCHRVGGHVAVELPKAFYEQVFAAAATTDLESAIESLSALPPHGYLRDRIGAAEAVYAAANAGGQLDSLRQTLTQLELPAGQQAFFEAQFGRYNSALANASRLQLAGDKRVATRAVGRAWATRHGRDASALAPMADAVAEAAGGADDPHAIAATFDALFATGTHGGLFRWLKSQPASEQRDRAILRAAEMRAGLDPLSAAGWLEAIEHPRVATLATPLADSIAAR